MNLANRLSRFALTAAIVAPFALAQDDIEAPAFVESHAKGVRGDVHGIGWDEIMKLKGEPLAPRFPKVGDGIERRELANGLVVYLAEDRKLPVVNLELTFRAGEDYEDEKDRGLANALLDRMRRGGIAGTTGPDLEEKLSALSINVGGRAGDETANVSLDTLSRNLDEALAIFGEVVLRPSLTKREGDSGRDRDFGGFGGGGRGGRGGRNPQTIAGQEFRKLVYGPDHPSARSGRGGRGGGGGPGGPDGPSGPSGPDGPSGPGAPGGTTGGNNDERRGSDRFEQEQLVAAHARFVRPDNSILVVTGDFDTNTFASKLESMFGTWAAPADPKPAKVEKPEKEDPPIAPGKPGVYVADVPGTQSAILVGHLGVDRTAPDRYAIQLMNDVLGGGSFASRITERVRSDEGLAYSATSSFSTEGRIPGTFQCSVQTKTASTARAVELLLEEIERMRQPGTLSKNEFETARESRLYAYALQFTSRSRNVSRLVSREMEGRPLDLDEQEFNGLSSVTPADIEAAAQKHLRPQDLYIVVAGDLAQIKEPLSKFGEVNVLDIRSRGRRGSSETTPPTTPEPPTPQEPPTGG